MGKWTRRGFITAGCVAGGAFVVGVAIRPGHRVPKLKALVTGDGEELINAWVKVGSDNSVTAIVPHAEMGQGVHTSLAQMLADEMDADWSTLSILEAPAHEEYANYALGKGFMLGGWDVPAALMGTIDGAFLKISQNRNLQITGGSTSVRATGMYGMRVAGAAAREMLLLAASKTWNVPVRDLRAEKGRIYHAPSKRKGNFADFAAVAGLMTPPPKPTLKTPNQFSLIGKSVPRVDALAKVNGSAQFGIDARVSGMRYATIVGSPVFGGKVRTIDDTEAMKRPGVSDIVNLGDAVAVVGDGYWQAKKGLDYLAVDWDTGGNEEVSQRSIFEQFSEDLDRTVSAGETHDDVRFGDVESAFTRADQIIEAEYRVPYLAHAPMEPLNCTAWLHDGLCEIWTGSQNPLGFRAAVASALEMESAKVLVHNAYLGGGFGRRFVPDYAVQAARVAQAIDAPVQLIWSREEDVRQDRYRPAVTSRFKAALDLSGVLKAWTNQYVGKDAPSGAALIPYGIENQYIHHTDSPTHVPLGAWRSVDHSQHGFFTESFIDEVAHAASRDPYEFRRELLSSAPRYQKVLDAAANAGEWGSDLPAGFGRGIAIQRSFGTIVAQVVDVSVEQGKVGVNRVVCAVDPGFAVNPDGLIAQMESGIIYGLTAALYGEISIENGAVKQSNFHDYEMLRMDESPEIKTIIINSGEELGGAGEPATPVIAPALVNAIFDATGLRIRELPIKNYDF